MALAQSQTLQGSEAVIAVKSEIIHYIHGYPHPKSKRQVQLKMRKWAPTVNVYNHLVCRRRSDPSRQSTGDGSCSEQSMKLRHAQRPKWNAKKCIAIYRPEGNETVQIVVAGELIYARRTLKYLRVSITWEGVESIGSIKRLAYTTKTGIE